MGCISVFPFLVCFFYFPSPQSDFIAGFAACFSFPFFAFPPLSIMLLLIFFFMSFFFVGDPNSFSVAQVLDLVFNFHFHSQFFFLLSVVVGVAFAILLLCVWLL